MAEHRITVAGLAIGLTIERRKRGEPKVRGEIVGLHRKDRAARVRCEVSRSITDRGDPTETRYVPFAELTRYWRAVGAAEKVGVPDPAEYGFQTISGRVRFP